MERRLAMSDENNRRSTGIDKYQAKLKLYEGFQALPAKVSRANSAVVCIATVTGVTLVGLAGARAPWYAYLIFALLSTVYCLIAVWREKHAKTKYSGNITRTDSS
jgi:hypothetical protein